MLINFESKGKRRAMPIFRAKEALAEVEASREWVTADASKVDVTGGRVKLTSGRKGEDLGVMEPFAFQQLRRLVGARPHQVKDILDEAVGDDRELREARHMEIVTERLRKTDRPIFLRRQLSFKGKPPRVLSALTERYEHMPYDRLLDRFPKTFKVHRLHVDSLYASVHLAIPKAFMDEGGGLHYSFRITTSDIGAAKLRLAYQILRMVCSNGLIVSDTLWNTSRLHVAGTASTWNGTVNEGIKQSKMHEKKIIGTIEAVSKEKVTEEAATDLLIDMGLPRKRIEEALSTALSEFGELTRWSVANGVSEASHSRRPGNVPVAISTADSYDAVAARFLESGASHAA